MSQTLFVMARIVPKPEHLEQARDAIVGIVDATRREPGCLQFVLHEGNDDGSLYLYEEWTDAAALDRHYEQPYTRAVFESYDAWLAEPVDVRPMAKVV